MSFKVGDPVPWFTAATHGTPQFQFAAAAGRYVVLSFLGSAALPPCARLVQELEALQGAFDDTDLCFFGVSIDAEDFRAGRVRELLPGIRWFHDTDGAISRRYEALADSSGQQSYAPFSLLLDTRLRVLARLPLGEEGSGHIGNIVRIAQSLPPLGEHTLAAVQAPVLVVPRLFEPDLCRALIEAYHAHGSEDSGFMRDHDGKTVGVYDYETKRRRDSTIEDENLRRACMVRVHDRLAPEIERAYQFRATRMERYIVACYEGDSGGHFRAHRDNTTKATAHRKFAVSVNLNEDYDGGYIWFPEYGRQLFRPPAGGAVVFSCSMLHEATAVTRGKRFVFLPFLYDDAAAKIREETQAFLGGNLNAPPGEG